MKPKPNAAQQQREVGANLGAPTDHASGSPEPASAPIRQAAKAAPSPLQMSATGPLRRRAKRAPQTTAQPQSNAPSVLDIAQAVEEIKTVPPATIHRAAAFTWSARAIACYRVCAAAEAQEDRLRYLYLGEHYREAALAHAAMGEQWEPLYAEIDRAMTQDRSYAFDMTRQLATESGGRPRAQSRRGAKGPA